MLPIAKLRFDFLVIRDKVGQFPVAGRRFLQVLQFPLPIKRTVMKLPIWHYIRSRNEVNTNKQ